MSDHGYKVMITKFSGDFEANDAVFDSNNLPAQVVAVTVLPDEGLIPVIYFGRNDNCGKQRICFIHYSELSIRKGTIFRTEKIKFAGGFCEKDAAVYKGKIVTVAGWEFSIKDNQVPILYDGCETMSPVLVEFNLLVHIARP